MRHANGCIGQTSKGAICSENVNADISGIKLKPELLNLGIIDILGQ